MASGTLTWRRLCKMAVILFEWWPDSFASKLQRSRTARDVYAQQVRIRQLCGHAPERERDDAGGGHLAHAELQQQHAAVTALAREALVSSEALAPCRTLQKRVVVHPRHKLPAAVRASGDVLAADLEPRHARELLGGYSEGGMRVVSTRHNACGSS